MKKILLFLLFLPLIGWTQDTADYSLKKLDLKGIYRCDTFLIKKPPLDTIPCIMMVCDTNSMRVNEYYLHENIMVWWQKGYDVREKYYYMEDEVDYIHLYYLDSDKKRLSKNIVVWMSKSYN